jgi:hypothetical protein
MASVGEAGASAAPSFTGIDVGPVPSSQAARRRRQFSRGSLIGFFGDSSSSEESGEGGEVGCGRDQWRRSARVITVRFVGKLREPTWNLRLEPWPNLPRLGAPPQWRSSWKTATGAEQEGDTAETRAVAPGAAGGVASDSLSGSKTAPSGRGFRDVGLQDMEEDSAGCCSDMEDDDHDDCVSEGGMSQEVWGGRGTRHAVRLT